MSSRRQFIVTVPLLPAAWLAATQAAAALPPVDEKDAAAASLGYVADAKRADKARFKQYAAGQACAGCALYQGASGAADGPCPIYPGKAVNAKGWCSAFVKKP